LKLLFDENLSLRLISLLQDLFPHSLHLHSIGLGSSSDTTVWAYAHTQAFTIVTQDADFYEYSLLKGWPPKVIWIRKGNCSTDEISQLLRTYYPELNLFFSNPELAYIVLR